MARSNNVKLEHTFVGNISVTHTNAKAVAKMWL